MSEKRTPVTVSASGLVGVPGQGYGGYTVTTVTATAALQIRDGSSTGQVLDSIPAGTAVGTTKSLNVALKATNGVYFFLNGGTGAVVLHMEG